MKKYKVLIIGAGHAGTDLHYPAYSATTQAKVMGFCDTNKKNLDLVNVKYGIEGFTDLDLALQTVEPDIISITTPPSTHYDIVTKVLQRGRVVIVEKPIFSSLKEAEAVKALEKDRSGKIVPVHNKLSQKQTKEAIRLYREGELGEAIHVNTYWMSDGNKNKMSSDPNHWSHSLTGGRWEELIPHRIYLAYQFLGKMELEYVSIIRTENCIPWFPGDEVVIVLKSETGFATIRLSINKKGKAYNYFEVLGTKSSYNSSVRNIKKNSKGILEVMQNKISSKENGGKHAPFIKDVIKAIDNGTNFPVSWDEALNTLELTIAIGQEISRQWQK